MSDDFVFFEGLRECTEEDVADYELCQASVIPFTAHWEDLDDSMKIMSWDSRWEEYIRHRAELLDNEGRESYLPWNMYKSLNLKWLDGYAKSQVLGDCCDFGHFNSLKASNLTNARRTGKTPRETAMSITYGIARGNGRMNHGSGLNLNPMARWSATVGNFWTSDFGKYDGGRNTRNWRQGSPACANALKTQSIIIHLPAPSFEHVYAVCAAGFGINMGTNEFPISSRLCTDNVATPYTWKSGNHAMAFIAAWKSPAGRRFVFLENSHGARYSSDMLNPQRQWGCWCSEADVVRMARNNVFRFGTWYCNLGEMERN